MIALFSRVTPLVLGLAFAAALPAIAQSNRTKAPSTKPDSIMNMSDSAAIASIVAAERAFRADVAAHGVRDGFIRHFAADGVLFRPGPVNALEFLQAQQAQPGLLEWEPAFAAVATSNDLGFTTGPWTYRPGEADSVVAAGHYATVWRRDADGVWRAVIDHGVGLGRPMPVPAPQTVATPAQIVISSVTVDLPPGTASIELESEGRDERASLQDELRRLDRDLSIAAGRVEGVTRFLGSVSDDARFLRQGRLPISGRSSVEALLMTNPGGVTYAPAGVGVSNYQDFAYTWGGYWPGIGDDGAPHGPETGNYIHVWRNETAGWRLVFEVLSPHPPVRKD